MDRGVFLALLYFSAVVLVTGLMILLLSPFLGAIAWAGVIALASQPLYQWLLRRLGGRKNLASFIATTTTVIVIAVPFFVLAILFAGEAVGVLSTVEDALASGNIPGWAKVQANPAFQHVAQKLQPYVNDADLRASALATLRGLSALAVGLSKTVLWNLFGVVMKFFVMVLVLFFAFRDGAQIIQQAWTVVPLKARDKELISSTVKRVVTPCSTGWFSPAFYRAFWGASASRSWGCHRHFFSGR